MNNVIQSIQIKIRELEKASNDVDFAQILSENLKNGAILNIPFTLSFDNGKFAISGVIQTEEQRGLINRILLAMNKQQLQLHEQRTKKLKTEILELAKKLMEDT